MSVYLFFFFFQFMFERQRDERGRRKVNKFPSSGWYGPQMSAIARVGQAEARIWELSPHLLSGWQGPKNLNHHSLPPRVHFSSKLEPEAELGLEPTHSDMT